MRPIVDILAASRDSGAIQLVIFLVIFAISVIGSLIKKGMESAKQRQADAKRQGYRPPADASQEDGNEPLPPVTRKTNADRMYEQARHRRLEHEQQKTFGHSAMQQHGGIQSAPALVPEAESHKTLVAGNIFAEQTRVDQELQRVKNRQQKLEQQREKQMATAEPYNETTQAIEARVLHVPAAQMETAQAAGPAIGLHLSDMQQAKAAIVFHEIFSPPKALRHEAQMWDM